MANQWEYMVEELVSEAATFAQYLNDEGGDGWELVTAVKLGADNADRPQLVFRREMTNPTWDKK